MNKTIVLIVAMLLASAMLEARDFDVVSPSGHTLYCDLVPGGAAIVGWDYNSSATDLINLIIPAHVSNNGANLYVVAIGDSVFMNASRMVSVEIPYSVRRIGRDAFSRCFGLGSIVVPSSVDSIGQDAFLFIPNVEYTGTAQGAPWGARNMNAYHEGQYYYSNNQKTHIVCCERTAAEATWPSTVTSIGGNAFTYCANITTLSIDTNIHQIGGEAFSYCEGLESVYFNPQAISDHLGSGLFTGCKNLIQLSFGETVTEIPKGLCRSCTSLKTIVIPDNIQNVNSSAFINCTALESAIIGSGISQTGYSLFEGCTGLKEVKLPNSLRVIGSYSFHRCWSLQEIIIPGGVKMIGNYAFRGCSGVNRIVCMRDTVPLIGPRTFDSIDTNIVVIVPCGKESLYSQAAYWQRFENFEGKSYYMMLSSNNPNWGHAVVVQQPGCDDHTAIIEAVPEDNCQFVKWSDNSTDNPRQITDDEEGYIYLTAIFESTLGARTPQSAQEIRISCSDGGIHIGGAQGQRVWVFDIQGHLLFSTIVAGEGFTIPRSHIPGRGIYLVKVGVHKAEKVVIM